jgi:hypothetical protein
MSIPTTKIASIENANVAIRMFEMPLVTGPSPAPPRRTLILEKDTTAGDEIGRPIDIDRLEKRITDDKSP